VVNDSRGFFTSRVFGTFVNEGVSLLGEGFHPASIENAGVLAGMPVGPLAICDEVSLSLMTHIRDQSKKDTEAAGSTWDPHPAEAVVDAMVSKHERTGKAAGAGFYEYPENGKKYLWPELERLYVDQEKARNADLTLLKERLLFIQAIETVRCLEENVLMEVRDANIGSIFGIGFAAWSGGALQYINQYGLQAFTERADELAAAYGSRFEPPKLLREKPGPAKHSPDQSRAGRFRHASGPADLFTIVQGTSPGALPTLQFLRERLLFCIRLPESGAFSTLRIRQLFPTPSFRYCWLSWPLAPRPALIPEEPITRSSRPPIRRAPTSWSPGNCSSVISRTRILTMNWPPTPWTPISISWTASACISPSRISRNSTSIVIH